MHSYVGFDKFLYKYSYLYHNTMAAICNIYILYTCFLNSKSLEIALHCVLKDVEIEY